MSKIRQAEIVILREEQKFGIHTRDPDGRIVPIVTSQSRWNEVELKKDDYRPLEEPSKTLTHAPHAMKSDVGVEQQDWTPSLEAAVEELNEETINAKTQEIMNVKQLITDDIDDSMS